VSEDMTVDREALLKQRDILLGALVGVEGRLLMANDIKGALDIAQMALAPYRQQAPPAAAKGVVSKYQEFDDEWVFVAFKNDKAVSFTRISDAERAAKSALEWIKEGYEIKTMTWGDMYKAMTPPTPPVEAPEEKKK